jgi:hypothetical protein
MRRSPIWGALLLVLCACQDAPSPPAAAAPPPPTTPPTQPSVQEEALAPATGVRGYLTTEPVARLQGRIEVRIDRLDPAGMVTRSASTAVERTRTIPEGVGYAERERIGHGLVQDLVDDLDAGLSANVRESFADLMRP